ncbi:MAG: hypothetical protein Q8R26_00540 [bacterium]|nr:hypothetical protein [bacterium]
MRKHILAFVLIILTAIAGFKVVIFLQKGSSPPEIKDSSNPDKTTPTEKETSNSYTVVFDTEGKFSPVYLKIKKGDTVVWANNGSRNIRPAVGPHPTHDLYPEFDPKQAVKPGEKFYFTFDRVGIWQYHNHLAGGQMVGMVEVSE